jgi:hypothetical protein
MTADVTVGGDAIRCTDNHPLWWPANNQGQLPILITRDSHLFS